MTIEEIAQGVIRLREEAAEAERRYSRARDVMYNALASQPGETYVSGGFKFVKTTTGEVRTMTKQSVIEALQAAELAPEVIQAIIGAALVETERGGGLRIVRTQA
ncbi:hypothetical protein GALL_231730 [mine drainage metagenome]|uniref:Uncharacterized protein n=1 Tax=mine drainage metagenome TaxID=410659 RepID=A0A1J5RHC5_9ZZZZ